MAYITKEQVKTIRAKLKANFPSWKFSVTGGNSSSVTVSVMSAPIRFAQENYAQINHYYPKNYQNSEVLSQIIDIVKEEHWDKSDSMTDYFHCAYYVNIQQGKWDKPFVQQ